MPDPASPLTSDLAAVIHIGATSVSLLIGAPDKEKGFRKLEYLDKPLPLARDIFRTGAVSRSTVEQAAGVLRDFQQSLNENGVPPEAVRCITTNILSEASNHEIFINRMQVAGGRNVELLDDGDMTRLIYQITLRLLKNNSQIAQANTLVSHIGPGNTRALYFRKGRIAAYSSYRLGIFRTREAVGGEEGARHLSHIEEQIRGVVEQLTADYAHFQDTDYHVAIGAEIQCAAPQVVEPKLGASSIELGKLDAFTKKLAGMSADEIVRKLHLHYTGGEGMVAALQTNLALARSFNDKVLVVPEGDFQRDLLIDLLSSNTQTRTFQDEVLQAARVIAKKYHTDRPHAEHVAQFAQQLFRELKDLHGLDEKYELLLRVAAILHEVGLFVSPREHHKHSLYLIMNSEIFGLSTNDRVIVALLARYHRRYNPNPNHPHFADLTREERLTVLKLAAILRLCDALDRSHSQRIKKIQSRREGETLVIETAGVEDSTVEQIASNGKSDLFEDIYGYEIVLRARPPSMNPEHYINREQSWLAFNERVLEEAERASLPLLERVKFLAITATNLDEFFMVRVGGLQIMKERGQRAKDAAGYTPSQQLDLIRERALQFVTRQHDLLAKDLRPALAAANIRRLRPADLTPPQRAAVEVHFNEQILPVLSPLGVALDEAPPLLPALHLGLMVGLREPDAKESRLVIIMLPASLPRHVIIPQAEGGGGNAHMNLEDLVEMALPLLFPQEQATGFARFRISRNSDIAVDDESALDLATEMEEALEARHTSATIRLEIEDGAPKDLIKALQQLCAAAPAQTYLIPGELDLRSYYSIADLPGHDALKIVPWPITLGPEFEPGKSIFEIIRAGDILLNHPYDSYEPVLQLIEEAAADPDVIAIKQILYRTARNSRIISALIRAAEAGKHVTVLVELKARFDELWNLERAENLLKAGAQILYGVRGLKTHAKTCLIVRRESGRLARYVHFGTGNYNETTAKFYTDVSLLTRGEDYGADASSFFNTVTGRSRFTHFNMISMAPFGLRERLVAMIESETERARRGDAAELMLKMNALEDPQMIEALYAASKAGVKVLLNVRGICCLRPGVKGLSEHIRVVSIIDRYLEHARIFWFRQGGEPAVFIASADFMTRNLSKRVELLVPVDDADAKERLEEIMRTHFADNTQSRLLKPDGTYVPVKAERGKPALRSQEFFAREAAKRAKARVVSPDVLIPHKPKGEKSA